MIVVNNLVKSYGQQTVLNIPSLEITKGQSVGLVGNNGAGKTTFFSLLLDLIKPTQGSIANKGNVVNENEEWKKYTGSFFDDSFLIGYLTPEEYFYFVGELRGMSRTEIESFLNEYVSFFNGEVLNQRKYLRDFSKGNQKKVGIIAAFMGKPELVILDEPFANLDPTTQLRLKELVKQKMKDREITIIISSHDLQHTYEVSDRVIALEKGQIMKDVLTQDITFDALEEFFQV
ncbi:ABC transporter ATP-binding protein [Myroides odoratimimus]|uniref:ABC transporter ATP-binding protein n=1 Tax=Myroides odoratimimus TaxID=76832 RepID=UPI001CE19FE5|nr:ABC transporter ATP-binding protein [Myroides odoratimimus]MCA4805046.1 ABC transporter ATP-binding protein [Myroides odoratimimus]MDM1092287.1 ABC transporter ATP-binding protein [Myroides odoratimimus]MDM1325695.1 ABC transporter ATP-binding protein [Myroides odoratimimus]MDM1400297.1 ABC transporter ATP-binding protein [Myroides odoratimimus]MDM1409877.1 ABC transporter ATP-binding protein [Myroides odoratimimus]